MDEMLAIREAEDTLLTELKEGALAPRLLRERASKHAQAREGEGTALSRGDVSLAFWRLLNRGEIVLTDDRTVRLAS